MLLSPTIDSNDQQTIVSAVMLSAMNSFDANKLSLLLRVYRQSADEGVRQRALVGWVFSLFDRGLKLFPEVVRLIKETVADSRCQQELTELQLQLIYCANAESDRRTIQEEIMPELMKGSNYRVTSRGIEEVEEDPMEDVLDPDASERRMEHVESAMNRMLDMQNQGVDVFFAGFSQMKRFPFFYDICNWFVPFDMNHPVVSPIMKRVRWSAMLRQILSRNGFCDSDKYSFVLAYEQVMDQMPDNVKQMLDRGEGSTLLEELNNNAPEMESPAFIRRMYLQGLYRFFMVYSGRSMFRNPFVDSQNALVPDYLFFVRESLSTTALGSQCCEVAHFLMKRKRVKEANHVLNNFGGASLNDYQLLVTRAQALRLMGDSYLDLARDLYKEALKMKEDDERVMSGLARSYFATKDFGEAYNLYEQLLAKHPDNNSFMLNSAACLVNQRRYEEALKKLYQLNYNRPDDLKVKRVLAWALVGAKKYEQAAKLYNELLEIEKPLTDDMLNYGFCLWCSGDVASAANMFHHYEDLTGGTAEQLETIICQEEHELLKEHGISDTEIQLMLDQV
jgi:tetratricopeptide (TPR) repeat protein